MHGIKISVCNTLVRVRGLHYLIKVIDILYLRRTVNGLIENRKKAGLLYFSERELTFTFALCHRRSVCLSVVCHL